MSFEMLIGLLVIDQETYGRYREEIAPLLQSVNGRFRYDVDVARTLKSESGQDINRLFVLEFPDRAHKERFFEDPKYRDIRARLFARSVERSEVIAEYTRT